MKIIALSGKMRSGKTTVGALLEKHLKGCNRVSFGDEVRREVARGMGYDSNDWKFPFTQHEKKDLRPVLQAWGHNMRKVRGKNYWINKLMTRITGESIYNSEAIWVIDDVRYLNELESIRDFDYNGIGSYQFHIIRLDCSIETQIRRGCSPEYLSHPSEVSLDEFEFGAPYCDVLNSDDDDCRDLFGKTLTVLSDWGVLSDFEAEDAMTDFEFTNGKSGF
jgi:dephospho-CoA kinase